MRGATPHPAAQELLDALPAAAALLAADGRIAAVNTAWTDFCIANDGDPAAVGPPADYLAVCGSTGIAAEVADGIRRVLDGSQRQFLAEYPCHGPDVERWFRVVVTPLGDGALVVHLDISGEYERVSQWLSATPIAVIELDADGLAEFVNGAWSRTSGQPSRALLGDAWTAPIADDDRELLLADVKDSAATEEERSRTVRVLDADSRTCWMRFTVNPYVDGYGRLRRIVLIGMDVTRERELLREQAADEERRRIGADVHDTVVQRLFSAGIALERAGRMMPSQPGVLAFAIDSIDRSITELRSIALAPPAEPETAPRAAVGAVLDQAERALGFAPEIRLDADLDRLGNDVVEHLVAVLSEGLANVARHAHATRCHVTLTDDRDAVTLRITDNGIGMPETLLRRSGTSNLERRAERLHGRAEWTPAPGGGTVLTWRVPSTRSDSTQDRGRVTRRPV